MRSSLRNVGVLAAALAVLVAAVGWLYLLRAHLGSGAAPVPDALPLYELSQRASVPLGVFLGVWGGAALLLGLLGRAARIERLTAALVLALGVGVWEYLSTGVSLAVIRQVPVHDALHSAGGLRAVYAPALLAGLAGALCGRAGTSARPRAPLLLAWGIAAAGAIGVVDAVVPSRGHGFLASLAPDAVRPVTSALAGPLALALLVAAPAVARRKRRAWQVSLALLGGSAALHLLHGFGVGAAATALLALGLVARRHDFGAPGDPTSRPRLALRALMLATGILVYSGAALSLNQVMVDQPVSARVVLRETGAALLGLRLHGSTHLSGDFAGWFPRSVSVAGLAAGGWLLLGWIAPWRYRLRQEAGERRVARDLVAAWGADTLAPFVLRADKSYFFSEDERAFVAYRVVGRRGDGVPAGFLHFAVCPAGSALSLSSMPRLRSTPNGFNEWLVCETVAWAREKGFARISLNFAPFAALLAPEAELSRLQRLERRALLRLKGRFQLDNLLLFNRKFFPSWQRRFVVYERRRDLPRIGIAALAAEAYLPFTGRERA